MRVADRSFALLLMGWVLAGCGEAPQETSNNAAAFEIEALPPDESVEAPADELLNADEPSNADAAQP